ncbi:hypothetical protein K469DRAFT_694038 [Zopfia rhizophila CBS 207.26]|uniref:DUF7025 domain-containing protein n=1 Tax=Zopfia rhizophila CBS 207.26 TaxID=1314779 RepID=A0A6A6DLL2_9PEZI|nr:hypothetical protein K469DRAFT_694038 [Zopfia rhizophila CBS 207.26]
MPLVCEEIVDLTGSAYFRVEGRFFDFNRKRIREATGWTKIEKFQGTVQINALVAYPLQFHPDLNRTRKDLIQHGRTFLSLRGIHYKEYDGNAFRFDDEEDKECGLVFLLQLPGVGKTLIAKVIIESHKTLLYAIAARELGTESTTVEILLSTVFKVTFNKAVIKNTVLIAWALNDFTARLRMYA